MCPVCFANLVLIAIGATSSGGLTTFALTKFLKGKKRKRKSEELKMKLMETKEGEKQ